MSNTDKLGFVMSDSISLRSDEEVRKLRGRDMLAENKALKAEWEEVTARLRAHFARF